MKNPHLSSEAALISLPTPDGHLIPIRHWPVARPRAVLHIVHGMAEHSGNYDDVAAFLNQYGFAVVAHDHRCHGLAVASETELGNSSKLQNWRALLQDMALVNNWINATYVNTPVAIVAHSMGSFISQWFVQHNPRKVAALALSGSDYLAPWFTRISRQMAQMECWRQGNNGRSDIIHQLGFGKFNKSFAPNRTEFDWLSRDSRFVDRYTHDPRCGFRMANRYWRDMLGTLNEIYTPNNMKRLPAGLPVYVFAGDRDPVGHMGKGVTKLAKKIQQVAGCQVTLRLYSGARHDTLHESNASEVRYDLLSWLLPLFPVKLEAV